MLGPDHGVMCRGHLASSSQSALRRGPRGPKNILPLASAYYKSGSSGKRARYNVKTNIIFVVAKKKGTYI